MKSVCAIALLAFNLFPTSYLEEQVTAAEEIVTVDNVERIRIKDTRRRDFSRKVRIGVLTAVASRPGLFIKVPCVALANVAKNAIMAQNPGVEFDIEPDAAELMEAENLIDMEMEGTVFDAETSDAFRTAANTIVNESFLSQRSDPPNHAGEEEDLANVELTTPTNQNKEPAETASMQGTPIGSTP